MLFSWHEQDYINLAKSYLSGNFHALLVYGAARSGQNEVVASLIKFILCEERVALQPCERCPSCILIKENNHPDLFILAADENEERKVLQIKVEQVRAMIEFAYKSSHISKQKVIHLPRLQELNISSANALLKILEEPPADCIFILQSEDIAKVLPTIKSRCFKFLLKKPSHEESLRYIADISNADFWLRYYDGEPLFDVLLTDEQLDLFINVLQTPSIDNIFHASKEIDPKKLGTYLLMEFILKWLNDLIQVTLGTQPNYFLANFEHMQKLSQKINKDKLYSLQSDVVFLLEWSNHPLNQKLQFENILLKYQQIYV